MGLEDNWLVTGRPTGGFRFSTKKRQKLDARTASRRHPGLGGGGNVCTGERSSRPARRGINAFYCIATFVTQRSPIQNAAVRLSFTGVMVNMAHCALWRSQQWDSNGARRVVGDSEGLANPQVPSGAACSIASVSFSHRHLARDRGGRFRAT